MKLSGCEAFIFDLDGVLLDSEPLHDKCSLSVLRKVGIIAESSVLSPFRGASSRVLWQNMKSKYGLSESEDELVRMQWETIVKMVPDCGIPASRGLAELLELLKYKGIPCAIASSSAREYIEAVLKFLDVESYFSEVVDGFMVTKGKPAPDIYLLAEAERDNLADPLVTFDANYAWELHHLLNSLAKGAKTVDDLKEYVARDAARFPKEAFRLTFTSNHDENSWSGTEFEREGAAANACAVLCFTLPGSQPLIYTGQEIGLSRRLEFFEKDPITDWSANEYTTFWKTLCDLKHNNPALKAGEKGGNIVWWDAPEGWVAFHREVKGNMVIVIANFGVPVPAEAPEAKADANDNRPQGDVVAEPFKNLEAAPVTMTLNLKGEYKDVFTGNVIKTPYDITLAPGEYIVLTK
ncbi:MAG: HAD hydrolase-like protein [Bacteroidales bacterium]|nr:HAD hydrolase-like protein [Bacteroidales bacterium]